VDVDTARIAIVKVLHRPFLDHIGTRVRTGCSCGDAWYPCPALVAALDAERQQAGAVHNGHRFDT
jgi:hypothetical protein